MYPASWNWGQRQFYDILEKMEGYNSVIIKEALGLSVAEYVISTSEEAFKKDFLPIIQNIVVLCNFDEALIKTLLNFSSDIIVEDTNEEIIWEGGATLLHVALSLRDVEAVEFLLDNGIQINVEAYQEGSGQLELDLLSMGKDALNTSLGLLLLKKGARSISRSLIDILCLAAYCGHIESIQAILESGKLNNLNARGKCLGHLDFPLNYAAKGGVDIPCKLKNLKKVRAKRTECMKTLLKAGALCNPSYQVGGTTYYRTPLHALVSPPFTSHSRWYSGPGPYMIPFKLSDMVTFLIIYGVRPKIKDYRGKTAKDYKPQIEPVIKKAQSFRIANIARFGFYKEPVNPENKIKEIDGELLWKWRQLSQDEKIIHIMVSTALFKHGCPTEIAYQILNYLFKPPFNEHTFPAQTNKIHSF